MDDLLKNARCKVVGAKQTLKALERGDVIHLFVARDAEERVVKPVITLGEENSIAPYYVDTMLHLGKMCGIKVKAAVAAITEE